MFFIKKRIYSEHRALLTRGEVCLLATILYVKFLSVHHAVPRSYLSRSCIVFILWDVELIY